jgi:arylsulfatase
MSTRPNILLYCTDQQRFDTIGALGCVGAHTPVLDKLVGSGISFTRAYCQSPICTPSRATILTGRYPATHHVHRNGNEFFPSGEKLLTKRLAEAGWDCGLVGKLHLSASQGEIEQRNDDGFSSYHWSHHPYPDIKGNQYTEWLRKEKKVDPVELYSRLQGSYGEGVPEELHQTTWCTEMTLRFLEKKRSTPWMLSINPFSPHPTFHPPKEYLRRFDPSQLPLPAFKPGDIDHQLRFTRLDQQTIEAVDIPRLDAGDRQEILSLDLDKMASIAPRSYNPRLMKACYYAEIELVDHQFGRILEFLDKTGQRENTLIIFTSDHGELLGDHGLLFKGCRFYESLVHIPLIMAGHGDILRNIRSDALVESVDIAPTIMQACLGSVPEEMQGQSLWSMATGRTGTDHHKAFVTCEYNDAMAAGTTALAPGQTYDASHGTMFFDGRFKLNMYHGHDLIELYDLQNDPHEFKDLWPDGVDEETRISLLMRAFEAAMSTSGAGIRRTKPY